MSADPSDVDFVVADGPAAVDEDLPETADSPWWLRARVPLGVAAAVALLAAVLFRVSFGGSGSRSPAAAPGSGRPTPTGIPGPTLTVQIPEGRGGDPIRIGPIDIGRGCGTLPLCIASNSAPDSMAAALHDFLPHARILFARTFIDGTGIAGRHHRFRSATLLARRGPATVRIAVSRTANHGAGSPAAGERESAFGSIVYAHAYFDGYFISVVVTAPTGHGPLRIRQVLALAGDARLRPKA